MIRANLCRFAQIRVVLFVLAVASFAAGCGSNGGSGGGGNNGGGGNGGGSNSPLTLAIGGNDFAPSEQGASFTLTLTNTSGSALTLAGLGVQVGFPSLQQFVVTGISGTGWTCVMTPSIKCSRTDNLAAGAGYPAITVIGNPQGGGGSFNFQVSVQVSLPDNGGGLWDFNESITDTPAVLSIAKTHSGDFIQGQEGAVYTITVSNAANVGPTVGTVTEISPSGLILFSLSGDGWTCSGTTCTRSDALAPKSSYPVITATVNVANNATSPQVNQVMVTGGGSGSAAGSDSTNIDANTAVANGPALSGIAPASGPPLTMLTLAGNFDPSNTVWAHFSTQSGYSVSEPAIYVTPTSAIVAAPLLVNGNATPYSGTVFVQVLNASGGQSSTSSFSLSAMPADSPLAPGTLTLGFLQGELAALQSYRQSIQGSSADTANFETAYNDSVKAAGEVITAVQSVINGAASASIGTFNGKTVNIKSADLGNADALLLNTLKSIAQFQANGNSEAVHPLQDAKPQVNSDSSGTIQQDASTLYGFGSTVDTSAGQLTVATSTYISDSANANDNEFVTNQQTWVTGGFGVGQMVACNACTSSGLSMMAYITGLFYSALVEQEWAAGYLPGQPSVAGAFNTQNAMYQGPNSGVMDGPAGDLNKAAGELQKNSASMFCAKAPCGVFGTTIQLFVQDNAFPPSITSVQVCATYSGQEFDACGPANYGFGVNQIGAIVLWANPATVYTLSLPPQPADSYCGQIQDGTGMAGANNPVAIVDCD
jgi:hypothetical protein